MIWKRLLRWSKIDQELDEEIRAHLRMAVEQRIARGEDPREAGQNARREFGNVLLVRETAREIWMWVSWERAARDLQHAIRQLRRSPGFAAVAILTLALGLAATTAIFSIVDGVLLQPLRYREPERLYTVESVLPPAAGVTRNLPVNARHFHEWRTHCRSCEDVALFQGANLTLVGAGDPVRLPALEVSFNFFRTLGVHPAMGRDFAPGEEGNFDKVILTDALWRSRFAGDRSILGKSIRINGESHQVIGILPSDPRLPQGDQWGAFIGPPAQPMIFRPLTRSVTLESPDGNLNYSSLVRLKPGAGRERTEAELNALLADFVREFHLKGKVHVTPLRQQVVRNDRGPLILLLAAVGSVLLIVCVNIGNLMLVRTASRYREAGVRLALGAGRFHLFGLIMTEALVLVAAGAAAGMGLAYAGLKMFLVQAPVAMAMSIPRLEEVRMDWQVLLFAAATSALCAALCGVVPAWQLARIEPHESLKAGGGNATEAGRKLRFREIMVGVEVALSTVLLIVGGLLMVSFFRLLGVDKGFDAAHVVTQDVSFLSPKYARGVRRGFVREIVERFGAIPGVQAVGAVNQLPLLGDEWVSGLRDPDNPQNPAPDNAHANFRFVTPGYFKAIGVPLRQGRFLEEADRDRPVAVISERAARFLWGSQNPIGRRVRGAGLRAPALEVVGVAAEVRGKLEDDPPMMVYEHFWRMQPVAMSFVLRTRTDPAPVAAGIRSILASADPEMAISPARTMDQILEASVSARRLQTALAAVFAISALALASLGIYGVISFTVARRAPEMGVRIALGAGGGQLVRMVIRQGMIPVAAGLAAGILCALMVSRLMASQLYGVGPNDPYAIGGVAAILLAAGLCACWIPARRATRIDPLTALRCD